jgi:hypothetical protein
MTDKKKKKSSLDTGVGLFKTGQSVYKTYEFAAQHLSFLPGQEFFKSDETKILEKLDIVLNKLDDIGKSINSKFDELKYLMGNLLEANHETNQLLFLNRFHILKMASAELQTILSAERYGVISEKYLINDDLTNLEHYIRQSEAIKEVVNYDVRMGNYFSNPETLKTYFEKTGPKEVYSNFQDYVEYAESQFKTLSKALEVKFPYKMSTLNAFGENQIQRSLRAKHLYNLYLQYELALALALNFNIIKVSSGRTSNGYSKDGRPDVNVVIEKYNTALFSLKKLYLDFSTPRGWNSGNPFLYQEDVSRDNWHPSIKYINMKMNVKIEKLSKEEEKAILEDDENTPYLKSALNKFWGFTEWTVMHRLIASVIYNRREEIKLIPENKWQGVSMNRDEVFKMNYKNDLHNQYLNRNHVLCEVFHSNYRYVNFDHVLFSSPIKIEE